MTDGVFPGTLRLANPVTENAAFGAMGGAAQLKTSLGGPSSSPQGFASFLSRMQAAACTVSARSQEGQKREAAVSAGAHRPVPANQKPINATLATRVQPGRAQNRAPESRPGIAQRISDAQERAGHLKPEMPSQAALATKTHSTQPSRSDKAAVQSRISSLQDPWTNPSAAAAVAAATLPAPALPFASRETAVPGPDRADSRSEPSGGLSPIESSSNEQSVAGSPQTEQASLRTTSPRGLAAEEPGRAGPAFSGLAHPRLASPGPASPGLASPGLARTTGIEPHNEQEDGSERISSQDSSLELSSHATDQRVRSTGSDAKESPSTPHPENRAGIASTAQRSISQNETPAAATDTVAPPPSSPDAHRSHMAGRIRPASSSKECEAEGAPLATGMAAAAGAGTNAAAPHPGGLHDSFRASVAAKPESGLDRADAFKSLDGESSSNSSVRWVHAGAQQAEAGFDDPALGWVSVRAHAGSGGVHPALIPSSGDAAQVLAGHLAGLNSFLANRAAGVGDVTVASPESGASGTGTQAGSGQGSSDQQRENPAQQATPSMRAYAGGIDRSASSASRQQELSLGTGNSAAALQDSSETYISVMV